MKRSLVMILIMASLLGCAAQKAWHIKFKFVGASNGRPLPQTVIKIYPFVAGASYETDTKLIARYTTDNKGIAVIDLSKVPPGKYAFKAGTVGMGVIDFTRKKSSLGIATTVEGHIRTTHGPVRENSLYNFENRIEYVISPLGSVVENQITVVTVEIHKQ